MSLGEEYFLAAPEGFAREGAGIFTVASMPEHDGRELVVIGYGTMEPYTEEALPLRLVEFGPDGVGVDRTEELISGGLALGEHPRQILFGDFNEDGAPDIYVADHGFDSPPFSGHPNSLLLSQSDGTYVNASEALPGDVDFSHSAAVGDINGDGHLDIFVLNQLSGVYSSPYFLLGDGQGGFTRNLEWLPRDDPSWPEFDVFDRNFTSCYLLDVNNDDTADLILGSFNSGHSLVYLNNGTGNFSNSTGIPLPDGLYGQSTTSVLWFTSLDIDADGDEDLLVSQADDHHNGLGIQVLINNRDGTFNDDSAQRLLGTYKNPAANWIVSLNLKDLDADGDLDFYEIGNDSTAEMEVLFWLNDGSGKFSPQNRESSGILKNPIKPAVVDFNKDGLADLVDIFEQEPSIIGWDSYLQESTLEIFRDSFESPFQ